jgi:hypothetical protein
MGSINSEGIYEYDGTDSVTPIQTYSNLLSASVTSALAALRSEIEGTLDDSGWVNIILQSGWTGSSGDVPQVRRFGPIVVTRGAANWTGSGSAPTGNVTFGSVPSGQNLRPTAGTIEHIAYAGVGAVYRITVNNAGLIQGNNFAGSAFRFSGFAWGV